jgi:UDP-2,3-diacylglucosamine pyrophosphatase LpxH
MRYLVTSDLHLGNHFSRNQQFTTMVQRLNRSITIVLAGDTIDAPGRPLTKDDLAALDTLRKRASHEQVIWIKGNHDEGYHLEAPGNIQFVNSYAIGKRLYISHGDTFDTVMSQNRWFIKTFRFFHNLRMRLGADPVHVADYAKKYQTLYTFLRRKVMNCAVEYGNEQNFKAVACGHVHFAEDIHWEGIRYINLGAWTESPCHCLLVDEEKMKLTTVEDAMQDSAWFSTESNSSESKMVK